MKLKYEFAVQALGEGYAAVAIGRDAGKFSGMLRVNETGRAILEALKTETSAEQVVAELEKQFQGDEAHMAAQADAFIAKLRQAGLLTE